MSKFLSSFFILLLLATHAVAQVRPADTSSPYQGFSGGMMLHAGALFGQTDAPVSPLWRGATYGIGGAARVHLWNHLRVGAEGFVSTMPSSLSNQRGTLAAGSYIRCGWGGLLADACWRREKIWPYVGGTLGGGVCHSLYVYEGNQDDWLTEQSALVKRQSFVMLDPYCGLDYCVSEKVHLTFRLDYMLALHRSQLLHPTGPRFYFGFMFCH